MGLNSSIEAQVLVDSYAAPALDWRYYNGSCTHEIMYKTGQRLATYNVFVRPFIRVLHDRSHVHTENK